MTVHYMLDLETASTAKNAAILSIACVKFTFPECKPGEVFYRRIDPSFYDNFATSFSVSVGSVQWWMTQETSVRNEAWGGKGSLDSALEDFCAFMAEEDIRVWAHGKDFDPPILENALRVFNRPVPWKFYQTRDTRTVYELGNIKPVPVEEYPKHHPVGDCQSQIVALKKSMNNIFKKV